MHTQELICFGARPGQGNPALVVEGAPADPDARRRLAHARDTTCVFVDTGADGTRSVDYWYPHARSPLCLHATLAVAALLFARRPDAAAIAVETAMHGQRLALLRDGGDYFVRLAPQPAPAVDIAPARLAALLRAPGFVPAAAPRTASVGSPKLLVEVADTDALYALAPDLAGIAAWGKEHGVNGIYAWCRRADGALEGRNFNHLDPALEDAATGVAAGALAASLGTDLVLRQGRAAGRDCLIRTRIDGAALLVGGAAQPAG
ncbi:PhzF family phenazine biosynthesis protein [uncultured Massilia sp.]|uniref:PhzF family phenazine biosynthesis protein n=1 Tax=uncultured Massilia sp. TaxID=169973 RepID=UPI0025DF369C|nr:PhzF family phenazine biosynthesis protein [uncultured Massilia sp.]